MLEHLKAILKSLIPVHHMTPNEILKDWALSYVGTDASPDDEASDIYGCVDSFEEVIHSAIGEYVGAKKTLSTYYLRKDLLNSQRFQRVYNPKPGTVILCATGYGGKNGVKNGHVGIVIDDRIASNDSRTGTWELAFTLDSWLRYFQKRGGYEVLFFDLKY